MSRKWNTCFLLRFEYRSWKLSSNYRIGKIIVIVTKQNKDIFLVGSDARVYLAEPMHKKYSTKTVWIIHLVGTYLTTDFSTPLSMYPPAYILDISPPFPQLLTYLMDGLFLIRILISHPIPIITSEYRVH